MHPAQTLPVSIRFGHVHCTEGEDYVELMVEDNASGIRFLGMKLSMAEFGRLVKGSGYVKGEASLRGLDLLGKKHVSERRKIALKRADVEGTTRKELDPLASLARAVRQGNQRPQEVQTDDARRLEEGAARLSKRQARHLG